MIFYLYFIFTHDLLLVHYHLHVIFYLCDLLHMIFYLYMIFYVQSLTYTWSFVLTVSRGVRIYQAGPNRILQRGPTWHGVLHCRDSERRKKQTGSKQTHYKNPQ